MGVLATSDTRCTRCVSFRDSLPLKEALVLIHHPFVLRLFILFQLVYAFFERLLDVKLVTRELFVFEKHAFGLFFLTRQAISERCNHLVALVNFDLYEGLNLIHHVTGREHVPRVEHLVQE